MTVNDIIVVAKFDYRAQEQRELTIKKHERLLLLDDSTQWWKVKRVESEENGYIPSNYARREKRSLLDKIISKRSKKPFVHGNIHQLPNNTVLLSDRVLSVAQVKFNYNAGSEDEISLSKGLRVNVLQKKTDGWWFIQYNQQRGWYPSTYLIETSTDNCNGLSLLNQIQQSSNLATINSPSSSSTGLSSSSSANSNMAATTDEHPTNHHFMNDHRHNSHPSNSTNNNTISNDYSFVIKPSKINHSYAHSDGTLDSCCLCNQDREQSTTLTTTITSPKINGQQKNSSWCALLHHTNNESTTNNPLISVNSLGSDQGSSAVSSLTNGSDPMQSLDGVLQSLTLGPNHNHCQQHNHNIIDSLLGEELWYYGMIGREDTEKLLKTYGNDGDFLIRDSERRTGNYSLSLKADNRIRHFRIENLDNHFVIGKRSFVSLQELIEHYKSHPIYDGEGIKLYLCKPLNVVVNR
ncbi:unnamed protein product [Didymodactylos carnosus]|uniref:Uncharacterized protein n=1 Tax=Didymodactylos carnosus TaxID=1234261 RepID=A0A814A850_9BILA|nr:unnamed protein product [Didymodactylos carnosus]CAF0910939.1 unnamed protein product [Didymodactylos carnosus]CAF3610186.1 unnamed protein product [Didymodactylos carnosus]CAF3692047.1 unnamed protein product [Didymodactylos carnosus]